MDARDEPAHDEPTLEVYAPGLGGELIGYATSRYNAAAMFGRNGLLA
jgi:hypothetical protein